MNVVKYEDKLTLGKLTTTVRSHKRVTAPLQILLEKKITIECTEDKIYISQGYVSTALIAITMLINFNVTVRSENTEAGLITAKTKCRSGGMETFYGLPMLPDFTRHIRDLNPLALSNLSYIYHSRHTNQV